MEARTQDLVLPTRRSISASWRRVSGRFDNHRVSTAEAEVFESTLDNATSKVNSWLPILTPSSVPPRPMRSLASYAPVHTLPSELLLKIFTSIHCDEKYRPWAYDEENDRTLSACSLVCRSWHSICLTPSLWTEISVDFRHPHLIEKQLQVRIARAQDSMLDIFVNLLIPFRSLYGKDLLGVKLRRQRKRRAAFTSALEQCLRILTPHSHRFRSFSILCRNHYGTEMTLLEGAMNKFLVHPFASSEASCLRSLSSLKISFDYVPMIRPFPSYEDRSPRSLLGAGIGSSSLEVRLSNCIDAISRVHRGVTSLDLSGSAMPFLSQVAEDCPHLEKLTLRSACPGPGEIVPKRARFSALQHLSIFPCILSHMGDPNTVLCVALFDTPNLETLELRGPHSSQIKLFNEGKALLTLKKLRLVDFVIHSPEPYVPTSSQSLNRKMAPLHWRSQFPVLEELHLINTSCPEVWPLHRWHVHFPDDPNSSLDISFDSCSAISQWPRLNKLTIATGNMRDIMWLRWLLTFRNGSTGGEGTDVSKIEQLTLSNAAKTLLDGWPFETALIQSVSSGEGIEAKRNCLDSLFALQMWRKEDEVDDWCANWAETYLDL
jgi:hypothetical protein